MTKIKIIREKLNVLIHNHFWILIILIAAFLIRIHNISFPYFTADEARIAYRGYTIATTGKDELGRSFPFIFNSLTDYQLPSVSYITALGILLFGKNDFGARILFVILSTLMVVLIFEISKIFNQKKEFSIFCALIAAFTPGLIFLSKTPNEVAVLTFSITLFFYLLTRKQINLISIILAILFAFVTSKMAWLILIPFTIFTLIFFQTHVIKKVKLTIFLVVVLLTLVSVFLYLQVPQSSRSLLENNFPIFQENSIKAVINKLRGQGLESGWPNFLEKVMFNRLQIITVGFLHWINHLEPSLLFSQFDKAGIQGFSSMGAFSKALLIPFIIGLTFVTREGNRKFKAVVFYILILTFPLVFVYPNIEQSMLITSLPFLIPVISLGLVNLDKWLKYLIISLVILEISINISFLIPEIKNANNFRPSWITTIAKDAYYPSLTKKVALSDNLVGDIVPFLEWFTPIRTNEIFSSIDFPYRFRQTKLSNIRIIRTEDFFYFCGLDEPTYVFASKRDLEKIQKWLNIDTSKTVEKIYQNNLGSTIGYSLKPTICVH